VNQYLDHEASRGRIELVLKEVLLIMSLIKSFILIHSPMSVLTEETHVMRIIQGVIQNSSDNIKNEAAKKN
jgi:hypothetical protein